MTRRRAWVPFTLFASLALVTLLIAGLRASAIRAYAVGVPSDRTVAVASPRRPVCEGPIRSEYAYRSVVLWGKYLSGKPLVRIVSEHSGANALISGGLVERSLPGAYGPFTAKLTRSVAADAVVDACVTDTAGEFKLWGSTHGYTGVAIPGSKRRLAFSLVMLEPTQHSLLGSLSLAFSRASLFRPSWVGTWTFWALLIALLGTVPLAAIAISAAIRSEDGEAD
jgi:hypothetical protein